MKEKNKILARFMGWKIIAYRNTQYNVLTYEESGSWEYKAIDGFEREMPIDFDTNMNTLLMVIKKLQDYEDHDGLFMMEKWDQIMNGLVEGSVKDIHHAVVEVVKKLIGAQKLLEAHDEKVAQNL